MHTCYAKFSAKAAAALSSRMPNNTWVSGTTTAESGFVGSLLATYRMARRFCQTPEATGGARAGDDPENLNPTNSRGRGGDLWRCWAKSLDLTSCQATARLPRNLGGRNLAELAPGEVARGHEGTMVVREAAKTTRPAIVGLQTHTPRCRISYVILVTRGHCQDAPAPSQPSPPHLPLL